MKKTILALLIAITSSNQLRSQTDTLFYLISSDSLPSFLYGPEQYKRFVQINLTYPTKAMRNNIQGTVYLSFVVDTLGKVNNIKILKDIGGDCGIEAVKLIKQSSGIWKPGMDKGKKVNVLLNFPIKFKCESCPASGSYSPNTDPNYLSKYYYDRADEEFLADRYMTAIFYYTKSLEQKPNYKDALSKRGLVKLKNNDKKGACTDWNLAQKSGDDKVYELINKNCK
ncbi:MAG: energy transducer TonB [Bacteroidetes bacterium]|nr:energy transducer TonB [Bacteroidota bacterium]